MNTKLLESFFTLAESLEIITTELVNPVGAQVMESTLDIIKILGFDSLDDYTKFMHAQKIITTHIEKIQNTTNDFMKNVPISDALASFLDVEHGSVMSPVDCTKLIHSYIKEHNLQNPEHHQEIFPDCALKTLLQYNNKRHGPLFYYTMQKLLCRHLDVYKEHLHTDLLSTG